LVNQSWLRSLAAARRRGADGEMVFGHHNRNLIAPLGQPLAFLLGMPSGRYLAKFRTPYPSVEVVPRIWPYESELLRLVGKRVSDVPTCLLDFGDWSVHDYLPGQALSEAIPKGPIGGPWIAELAEVFARLADVPKDELPPLPDDWPEDGNSRGFLDWLARFTEEQVHQPNRRRFGQLFKAVGIPDDGVAGYVRSVLDMKQRPFALLHTDLHRANVVVMSATGSETEEEHLAVIDWELAMYGDPLHDLATHLVRMDYVGEEADQMVEAWAAAMERSDHADMTVGLERDLQVYLDFEYAQSVFPDVMRAALSLPEHPSDQDLTDAAAQICRAMERAFKPLSLPALPDLDEAADALRAWHAADTGRMEWVDPGKGDVRAEERWERDGG
jgi:aminoglycoside phosphotransferase (APT) family kinase protein